jgi:hypothetical protein
MITLIYQSRRRNADKVKDICGGIFAAYGLDINSYNDGLPSHLKNGHDPTPKDLESVAKTLSIDKIDEGFDKYVVPLIHNEKHEALVRAIRDVLRDDSTIFNNTIVGISPGFEKEHILNYDSFDESALLANVITYAIISTENNKMGASIKEIGTGYVDGFISSSEKVFFLSPIVEQDNIIPLKRTLKDPMFDRIFKKATDVTIAGMSNPTRACVFYVDPMNCKFRFRDLKDFIINNIGSYVFSRAEKKMLIDRTKNEAAVGAQAMLKFIQKYGSNAETVLGEILLYTFLEQELDAPKIMSRIELDGNRQNAVSKSDGVHLLSLNLTGQPFHQLVFGASDINGNLLAAIDRAFSKIENIEASYDEEMKMIESTPQWTIYDPEATSFMVDLMTPQRGSGYKPDMAFGAFLGYTIQLDTPEYDSQKYRIAVKEQLKKDIDSVQPYIVDLIAKKGLSGHSFYFYVFPFNDAPNEKTGIIKEMLTGGVV